ncbi:MAG: insulinase family protein [Ruminococcaceae bacterium]|nr:insulinase family protein [Oscillospiraceae bacterium]
MNEYKIYELKAGLKLHHIKTDKFKTVSVGLHFHRPLRYEEASKNALLTDVMRRGNQKLQDAASVSRYLQALYGAAFHADVRRKGEDQILSYVVSTVADSYLPEKEATTFQAVSFLYDMVLCPLVENGAFRQDYVEQEKVNLINDIKAQINDKRAYAVWRLVEEMCKNEPYSIYELGRVSDVEAITPESLYAQYLTVLHESPIDIFVTGDADIDRVIDLTKKRFAEVTPKVTEYPKSTLHSAADEVRELVETYDVSQAKLSIGFYTGITPVDDEYSALMVYNSIFGSGAHSKLFNHVREKLSLCYYASSRLERYKGMMVVSSGIEYQNKEKAETEILAQAEAMRQGDISDYEFDVSVKSIVNSLRSLGDTGGYMADYYLGQAVSGTSISLEEQCELIQKVTKDDVIRVAQRIKPELVYVMKGQEAE